MPMHPPVQYVQGLELPDPPPQYEALEAVAVSFGSDREAAVVGAQIAEFSPQVTGEHKAMVADCLLLAQLAANKATAASPDLMAWYRSYVQVLQGIGWNVQSMDMEEKQVSDMDGGVHQAILPVLTAMLGPAAAGISMVVSVLKGLQEMDKDNPWITVFNRASQHASGAKLQFGFVDVNPQDPSAISVKLLALALDAKRTITQVLFFKVSKHDATLKKAEGQLGITAARLDGIRAAVAGKVQPFLLDSISKIDI
ncbi:MAG: hypothetical protein ABIQ06_10685 [Caldimonas sp.]